MAARKEEHAMAGRVARQEFHFQLLELEAQQAHARLTCNEQLWQLAQLQVQQLHTKYDAREMTWQEGVHTANFRLGHWQA